MGFDYEKGHGVGQDDAQSVLYYGRACDGGHAEGCNHLADMHRWVIDVN